MLEDDLSRDDVLEEPEGDGRCGVASRPWAAAPVVRAATVAVVRLNPLDFHLSLPARLTSHRRMR